MTSDSDKAELLVAVLQYYGGETRHGIGRSVRCPFHGDKHRSAVMTTDGQDAGLFYCHTCGLGGDALSLIMHKEGIPFRDALERAADIAAGAGVRLPQQDDTTSRGVFGQPRFHKRTDSRTSPRRRTSRL